MVEIEKNTFFTPIRVDWGKQIQKFVCGGDACTTFLLFCFCQKLQKRDLFMTQYICMIKKNHFVTVFV